MKKFFTVCMSLLLVSALSACGEPGAILEPQAPSSPEVSAAEPVTPSPMLIEKSFAGKPDAPYELYAPDYERLGYPHITGLTLYDKDGIRVTLPDCDLKPDFTGFYSIPIILENETDMNIRMMSFDFSINNKAIITTSGGLFSDAEPHSTVQAECIFYQSSINRNARAMALPRDFELVLTFFELENHERLGSSDVISFSSDIDSDYTETVEPYPVLLWEDEGISIRAGKMYQDDRSRVKMEFSVENSFGEPLTVTGVDIAINGEPVELRLVRWVIPGSTDYETMEISAKEMDEWGLKYEDIKDMSLSFTCTRHYEDEVLMESGLIELEFVDG